MKPYTGEEIREIIKRHNAVMIERNKAQETVLELEQEIQTLKDVDNSECWGWKVAVVVLVVYVVIDKFGSKLIALL